MSSKHTMLVVEDDDDLREFFRMVLRREGYEVSVARDGFDALRRIDGGFTPDLVILDLGLPMVNGYDVLQELAAHAETRSIPVVVVTASDARPQAHNVHCTLYKPVTVEQLLGTIEACLAAVRKSPPPEAALS